MEYIAPQELIDAKTVAQFLKRPLLLSGEPGTGKTTFADFVAKSEAYSLYVFSTKSISQSVDLFYCYDTISHFANKEKHLLHFLRLEPLGIAVLNALGKDYVYDKLIDELRNDTIFQHLEPSEQSKLINQFLESCSFNKSLVLIDEVDKAPRDFPNDILNEIENYEFKIKELGITFSLKEKPEKKEEIFIILTSNFEKNLPDAFLRRCIYYNIKFPDEETLLKIILVHVENKDVSKKEEITKRIKEFKEIRENEAIQKKPATSELIDCIRYLLYKNEIDIPLKNNKAALSSILKKNSDYSNV